MRAIVLGLLLATRVWVADAVLPPGDRAAIRATIEAQLDAFRRDDADGAWSYAAPNIQRLFGTPGAFMEIVRRGYRPVYRPRSADFAALTQEDGGPVQQVELTSPDGARSTALYSMEREPDGVWRITGCTLVASVGVGA